MYFDSDFMLFRTMFFFVFIFVIGMFGCVLGANVMRWNKNNHSPKLTVAAQIVSKRLDVSHHHHNAGNTGMHMSSSTSYYVTFEVESGDRMELLIDGREYGMLAEGDVGALTFQGTRYLGFERH